jgi:Bacterial Ig-like domain (group 2)
MITPVGSYTAQLEAVATLADGASQNVSAQAVWQSSNSVVAVVSATGFVAAGGFGAADITATYHGATGTVRVTFSPDLITVGLP